MTRFAKTAAREETDIKEVHRVVSDAGEIHERDGGSSQSQGI
jgi:hypothetical protein